MSCRRRVPSDECDCPDDDDNAALSNVMEQTRNLLKSQIETSRKTWKEEERTLNLAKSLKAKTIPEIIHKVTVQEIIGSNGSNNSEVCLCSSEICGENARSMLSPSYQKAMKEKIQDLKRKKCKAEKVVEIKRKEAKCITKSMLRYIPSPHLCEMKQLSDQVQSQFRSISRMIHNLWVYGEQAGKGKAQIRCAADLVAIFTRGRNTCQQQTSVEVPPCVCGDSRNNYSGAISFFYIVSSIVALLSSFMFLAGCIMAVTYNNGRIMLIEQIEYYLPECVTVTLCNRIFPWLESFVRSCLTYTAAGPLPQ